jgi:hypothetical protein
VLRDGLYVSMCEKELTRQSRKLGLFGRQVLVLLVEYI